MKSYLQSFNLLTDSEIEDFLGKVRSKSIKKGEFFIRQGSVCQEVAFVQAGALRSFYYSSTSEEVTYCFTFTHAFLSAYSSFLSQTETMENIQALTDVELLTVSREEILALEQSSTNWLRLFKLIAEQEYIQMEKRIFLLQKETAEKRYQDLLATQPELLQLVPLSHIASYLGITQRHLSRLRKSTTI